LGACGSDAKKTDTSTAETAITTSSTTPTNTVLDTTTTGVTVVTDPTGSTVATGSTLPAGPSVTSTTVGPRVVTSPSDNVHLGDSGDGVKQIQTALKAAGYKVTVDGQFGPQTATAVKSFQKKNGLKQDGVVGPKTWAKLSGAGSTSTSTSGTSAATSTTKA
jgi:peptidoglycan hydrolase-like protein with peptidoglycan-binding domain